MRAYGVSLRVPERWLWGEMWHVELLCKDRHHVLAGRHTVSTPFESELSAELGTRADQDGISDTLAWTSREFHAGPLRRDSCGTHAVASFIGMRLRLGPDVRFDLCERLSLGDKYCGHVVTEIALVLSREFVPTGELAATGAFVFIGFTPNSGLVKAHINHDPSGYLLTDDRMMTSIPGLFAAGDLRVQLTRQVTTAVGDATTAAIAVEKYLTELKSRAAV